MEKYSYLRRLPRGHYQGHAVVHWAMTVEHRTTGWLSSDFHLRFREWLTHGLFRQSCCCIIYCLMPDHFHLLTLGLSESSDQRRLIAFVRKQINIGLARLDSSYSLQKQPFDHVLKRKEREKDALESVADYIAQNPVRAGLVDEACEYAYTDTLVPGYPELSFWIDDYWERFWRTCAYLRERDDGSSSRERRLPGSGSRQGFR